MIVETIGLKPTQTYFS